MKHKVRDSETYTVLPLVLLKGQTTGAAVLLEHINSRVELELSHDGLNRAHVPYELKV